MERKKSLFLEDPPPSQEAKETAPKREQDVCLVKANAKSEANIPLPPCPYTFDTDVGAGVTCYIPGCAKHFVKDDKHPMLWSSLLTHVKNVHGVQHSWVNGTPFHQMAREEMNSKQQHQRKIVTKTEAMAEDTQGTKKKMKTSKKDESTMKVVICRRII